jgi:hypothetical protein
MGDSWPLEYPGGFLIISIILLPSFFFFLLFVISYVRLLSTLDVEGSRVGYLVGGRCGLRRFTEHHGHLLEC